MIYKDSQDLMAADPRSSTKEKCYSDVDAHKARSMLFILGMKELTGGGG